MRALVLAGGSGSRLRPITHTNAKQLIPVANVPILFHVLGAIRDAGITDVGVVTGATGAEIRAAVGDGAAWGLRVTYVPQPEPLGIAHAVLVAEEYLRGEPFLLFLGDNLLLEGVERFVRMFEEREPEAQILLTRVPEPEHFGVAVVEGERVVRLVEKPTTFVSDIALVGVYLFRDAIFDACRSLRPSARGELEITEAIQWLIDRGHTVRAELVGGWWKDTGRPDDLLEANRMLLSLLAPSVEGEVDADSTVAGVAVVEPGARIVRSTIVGPVVIGSGAVVEDATVGPDVALARGCVVRGATVEDSIVMADARIEGARLRGSLLGRGVEVEGRGGAVHRLVLGDQSRVGVD
ncbi:MAG: glucose-1-phosphate thymidylyltransferase [Actinomycetota bacterium]